MPPTDAAGQLAHRLSQVSLVLSSSKASSGPHADDWRRLVQALDENISPALVRAHHVLSRFEALAAQFPEQGAAAAPHPRLQELRELAAAPFDTSHRLPPVAGPPPPVPPPPPRPSRPSQSPPVPATGRADHQWRPLAAQYRPGSPFSGPPLAAPLPPSGLQGRLGLPQPVPPPSGAVFAPSAAPSPVPADSDAVAAEADAGRGSCSSCPGASPPRSSGAFPREVWPPRRRSGSSLGHPVGVPPIHQPPRASPSASRSASHPAPPVPAPTWLPAARAPVQSPRPTPRPHASAPAEPEQRAPAAGTHRDPAPSLLRSAPGPTVGGPCAPHQGGHSPREAPRAASPPCGEEPPPGPRPLGGLLSPCPATQPQQLAEAPPPRAPQRPSPQRCPAPSDLSPRASPLRRRPTETPPPPQSQPLPQMPLRGAEEQQQPGVAEQLQQQQRVVLSPACGGAQPQPAGPASDLAAALQPAGLGEHEAVLRAHGILTAQHLYKLQSPGRDLQVMGLSTDAQTALLTLIRDYWIGMAEAHRSAIAP
eukprot:TRINITY_DN15750_c0_g1_i2.p1 TRINITY_DN15750_c0_g1~~TRINITY_DN15750_c0_g1_i2.p1  ORF type:complete len:570 (+),score=120.31 TRINITY_DN15750_c0_g1_i2:106-1710(+)